MYRRMYAVLCAAVSDCLDAMKYTPETLEIRRRLEAGLDAAEELYLSAAEPR